MSNPQATNHKVLIFTGGHHTSALSVASKLKNLGVEIVWVGHMHSMQDNRSISAEYRDVKAEGIEFIDLKAGKFFNIYHPAKLIKVPLGFINAFLILSRLKIRHGNRLAGIVSFGGYLAVPIVSVGKMLGIKSITHEQTIVAGWANKFISLFVEKIALTWPQSLLFFPKEKSVVTGLPLRKEIIEETLKEKPKPSQKPVVYITGGKQGSHKINQIIFSALDEILKRWTVIHQTGEHSVHLDHEKAKSIKKTGYYSFAYDSKKAIDSLISADVVVGRSGAHTVYELGVLKKRCVLIPIPWVSHNEQNKNAQLLANSNQAIIVPEQSLTPEVLIDSINRAEKLDFVPQALEINGLEKLIELISSDLLNK